MRLLYIPLLACLAACTETPSTKAPTASTPDTMGTALITEARQRYTVDRYFPGDRKDTLLANMITFIHKRPTAAINRDRTLPEFRAYYLRQLPNYKHVFHTVTSDGTHWFYLIRPARSVQGDVRGVGGWFRTNDDLQLVAFAEVFNTRIMPEDELIANGLDLFEHLMANGDVDQHPQRRNWVEWPDDRLYYDTEKREWRYND